MAIDKKDAKKLLLKLVDRLSAVSQYADALYSENQSTHFIKDKTGIRMEHDNNAGVKLRVFDGSKFHEECTHGWNPVDLKKATDTLIERVTNSSAKGRVSLKIDKKKHAKDFATSSRIDPKEIGPEKKTAVLEELHKRVIDSGFVECQTSYQENFEVRIFVNKFKQLTSDWTGCVLTVVPFIQSGTGEFRSDFFRKFSHGFEVVDFPEEELTEVLRRAKNLAQAKRITPGKYKAVLGPNVTGLLAHESFGHGMEADTILHGRAKASEWIGKRISTAKVSICEHPGLPDTYGHLFFDDEGMIPEEVFLVERGMVRDPITDLYSSSKGDFRRSANGRAESFDRKIYARMTNTYFKTGKTPPEKLIKSIKNGVYIHYGTAGMEDPKGWGVQLSGLLCEKIKNGKLTGELFVEASMTGYLPDILKNIKAVGNRFKICDDAGHCAKNHKEWVRVSSGGPHLLIEGVQLS